ncbi:MAG: hypothetical protein ALECFALPRED_005780 [Alectoria fallacina]|uniref:Uncharacterized protein n=1 Tax=Alectoria fallacina TaxID=1903189 RepID=A0A8H3G3E6_9LECA|nr:MAG: hypothetical protein ALECFALPRED_005780 [Alectoria fallacina]
MGQNASTQRDREDFLSRDSRRFSQIVQDREPGDGPFPRVRSSGPHSTDQPIQETSPTSSQVQNSRSSLPIATFSRQISAQSTQSIPVLRGGGGNGRDISTRDEIFYEQREERPLADMGTLGMQNTPITHITASPMPRRPSRMARLSSMIMPRYAASGFPGNGQHGHGECRSLRRRLSNTDPISLSNEARDHHSRRLSLFGSLTSRSSTVSRLRRPRELAPISRPFPLSPDGSLPPSGFTGPPLRDALPSRRLATGPGSPPSRFFSTSRSVRLSRIRRSISTPFEAFLPAQTAPSPDHGRQLPPQRPSRLTSTHDPNILLPPLDVTDSSIDLNSPRPEPSPSNDMEQRVSGVATTSESPERAVSRIEPASWTERWTERGSGGRREGRRMPSMLRGRSSRLIRRDNDGPLPRILHLAATAIAAQLSGTSEQPIPDMQAIGPDDLDGSLNNFFRTLQNASSLTGETSTHDGSQDSARALGTLPPLNFLRVFRFVSQTSTNTGPNEASNAERIGGQPRTDIQSAIDENTSVDPEGRTVTLVVVGVRSVPSENIGHDNTAAGNPNLDSLMNFSSLAPTNVHRHGAGSLLRDANGRSRFPHRRRASIGGLNTFPANYDSQRHQRTLSPSTQGSTDMFPNSGSVNPPAFSESPPGPHPPPFTPTEPGLSAYSSTTTTPSRRPSSASAIQQPPMSNRDLAAHYLREAGISGPEDQAIRVQHRRRSDSEFARHRDLGAGAARRNGMVEPDEVDTGDNPAPGSRSWLIYVVGTNLSEDHPALTTPSLFTDNPTYEDMLLLSSLLGPAKPPVASREDVASASGTYRIKQFAETLIAEATWGRSQIRIGPTEEMLSLVSSQLYRCVAHYWA